MKRLLIEHGWPPSHIDLLLRANLAEESKAREAWQAWRHTRVLEDAEWREIRLLAPLARRIRVLEPGRPRRALLHLSHSCALPDTQDGARDTGTNSPCICRAQTVRS
jgi:hypothetical protein